MTTLKARLSSFEESFSTVSEKFADILQVVTPPFLPLLVFFLSPSLTRARTHNSNDILSHIFTYLHQEKTLHLSKRRKLRAGGGKLGRSRKHPVADPADLEPGLNLRVL
eukprot:3398825-Rhodomonas_salina.1